ncbi:MAG: PAS domain-containing protein [Calditrichaeota bacterium]|nr:PAS domain-containing protein [Calditrichota bacterium]
MPGKAKNKPAKKAASPKPFYVIGIGASAGGLEALKTFFDNVPPDFSHSFVIIQHLSPDYKSFMSELLAKNTRLPILEVRENTRVAPGSVYLITPNKNITIKNGELLLEERPRGHELNLPVDIFFASLADEKGERAIGVILSGTGSDGTRGVRAIKEVGGMVMVQSPEQAKFDGMPQSAIRTALVDFILPIEEMAKEIDTFINHPGAVKHSLEEVLNGNEETLKKILEHIHNLSELNFNQYKRPTLLRRIERRMLINKTPTLEDYLDLVDQSPQEAQVLKQEFLIGVTRFFRDPDHWAILNQEVLPDLVESKAEHRQQLRVWCVGCSTGEEVYSLGILLKEEMERQGKLVDIKIIATDIEQTHLAIASKGVYPESIVADVSPARLEHYFIRRGDEFHVTEGLRRMVVFSQHNILKDPPFKNMDLVICRNLMIYLQPMAQQEVLGALQYALVLNGTLMLGPSENIGDFKNYLAEIDGKARLFRNTKVSRSLNPAMLRSASNPLQQNLELRKHRPTLESRMAESLNEALAAELGLISVFVDENYIILHAIGELRRLIELPEKGFSVNFVKLLPEQLSIVVSMALRKAAKQNDKILYEGAKLRRSDRIQVFNILVTPFPPEGALQNSFVVTFIPQGEQQSTTEVLANIPDRGNNYRLRELEEELRETRENLQSTIEELETTNEELQATNEELLAANEELQSTNEELQSINEELHTVNAEHQQKIKELAGLNADMDNLMKSTGIGTIFLDRELCIRNFTPAIKEQFNLRESDIGRPLFHFTSNFSSEFNQSIIRNAGMVYETHEPHEAEVRTLDGKWYLKKITPFRNSNNIVDGVVISFIDISTLREIQDKYAEQKEAFAQVLENTLTGYWILRVPDNHLSISRNFKEMLGYGDEDLRTQEDLDQVIHPEDLALSREMMARHIASGGKEPYALESRYFHREGHVIWIFSKAKVVDWKEDGAPLRIVGSQIDITNLKQIQSRLELSNRELQQFAFVASHDLQEPLRTITNFIALLSKNYHDKLDAQANKSLEFLSQAASRMSEQIKGLLDYSRIGKRGEVEAVDLDRLTREVLQDIGASVNETETTVDLGELPVVSGISSELRILMLNLISNAIKFRKDGEKPFIRIRAERNFENWSVSVADNGIGIAEEHQERIFQIFQRLHTRKEYEGTGIGLANCKKIVEIHGGRIGVKSIPEEGSTFTFTLPHTTREQS